MKFKTVEVSLGSVFEGTRLIAECVPLEDSTTANAVATEIASRVNVHAALVEACQYARDHIYMSSGSRMIFDAVLKKAGVR